MVCEKCGSSDIGIERDKRGLPLAYCKSCGCTVKRLSTTELMVYYEEKLADIAAQAPVDTDRPACPYCTEKYIMLRGNERTRVWPTPLDIRYCPICGRKVKASDKVY